MEGRTGCIGQEAHIMHRPDQWQRRHCGSASMCQCATPISSLTNGITPSTTIHEVPFHRQRMHLVLKAMTKIGKAKTLACLLQSYR